MLAKFSNKFIISLFFSVALCKPIRRTRDIRERGIDDVWGMPKARRTGRSTSGGAKKGSQKLDEILVLISWNRHAELSTELMMLQIWTCFSLLQLRLVPNTLVSLYHVFICNNHLQYVNMLYVYTVCLYNGII